MKASGKIAAGPMALDWIRSSWIPEIFSFLGVVFTVVGFFLTFREASQAKSAAQEARDAARSARDELIRIESFIDLSAVIATMENIRVLHREQAWTRLVDRYSEARRLLIQVRVKAKGLLDEEREIITGCISNFSALEKALERNLDNQNRINTTRANIRISDNIDSLVEILHVMRDRGRDNVQ